MVVVTEKIERILRHTLRQEGPLSAVKVMSQLTGCNIGEAKEWITNCEEEYRASKSGCPYCGRRMRSPEAKQCRRCMRDWHDEANILRLGTDQLWREPG